MAIPSEFNGHITFFWHASLNFLSASQHDDLGDDWIKISDPVAISVELYDVRKEQIAALEQLIEKERAESQFRINHMLGKIQELQAIESK